MVNPYSGIAWDTVNHVCSLSHTHSRKKKNDGTAGTVYQSYLNNAVNGGAEHIAFSNYYPSEPFCPLSDWFETVPDGVFCSPNAEHHNLGVNNCHINGLGSTLVTGQNGGLSPTGMAYNGITSWQDAFTAILNNMVYDDAGGVTINHPVWSNMSVSIVEHMLDYDTDRILGIEICNDVMTPDMIMDGVNVGYAIEMWDEILMTGRRCWGFCVPDHGTERTSHWTGRNILLVDESTSYNCLKAYRDGAFYSKIFDSELAFSEISFVDHEFTVSAPLADSIVVIVDGVPTTYNSNTVTVNIPSYATYCRAEAHMAYSWTNESGNAETVTEKAFTNPIILNKHTPMRLTEMIQRVYDL